MGTIHCHVPIRVRVSGRPDAEDLAELAYVVRRQVRDRIAQATELIELVDDRAAGHASDRAPDRASERPSGDEAAGGLAETYDETRATDAEALGPDGSDASPGQDDDYYLVPSYDGGGRPVAVPVHEQTWIPGYDWRVLRSLSVRLRVGDFLDWAGQVTGEQPPGEPPTARPGTGGAPEPTDRRLPSRALYADWEDDVRRLVVWLVETRRSTDLQPLLDAVSARAQELDPPSPGTALLNVGSPFESARSLLAARDPAGQVAQLPSLAGRNARRVEGSGATARVLRRGLVLWAGMALPEISVARVLEVGPLTQRQIQLIDADLVTGQPGFDSEFATAYGTTWAAYLAEAGRRTVRLDLLAARVRADLPGPAVEELLGEAYADALAATPAPPDTRPAYRSFLVGHGSPDPVIETARQLAGALPAARPVRLPAPATAGSGAGARIRPGRFVVHAVVHLPVDTDTLAAAQQRPAAAPLAARLRQLLSQDAGDRQWKYRCYDFLGSVFGHSQVAVRPAGGTTFEFVLADLDRTGDLARLFDAVEASGWFALEQRLLRLSLPTTYAAHPRVTALLARLRAGALAGREHTYHESTGGDVGWIELDHDQDRRVSIGVPGRDVLVGADASYLFTRTEKQLKAPAATRFREALITARGELLAEVARGQLTRTLTPEEYLQVAIDRAARTARLTDDDFTKVTIEKSIRVTGLARRDLDQLPSWDVTFEIVERVEGSAEWTAVSAPITETSDEFEARLVFWRLGKSGEFYEAIGLGITIIGVVAVAWEAGVVALLVEAAGGTAAVVTSISVSVAIYIIRVIFFDAKLSVEGFLMAAVEGYLGALGFRAGAFLARPLGRAIGTATVRRVWAGVVVEKLVAGAVGGGVTEALNQFAEDVVEVVLRDGSFHSATDYARRIGLGAAMGVVGEFTISPVLHALGGRGLSALSTAADLVAQLRRDGFSLQQLAAGAADGLGRMERSLVLTMAQAAADGYVAAFRAQVEEVLSAWGARTVARRVLELGGLDLTRTAVSGLERFVQLADGSVLSQEGARRLAASFAAHPMEAVPFLEVLGTLDEAAAVRLMRGTFDTDSDLLAFLARIGRYTPEQQRGVLNLLVEANVVARPPGGGQPLEAVLEQQHSVALRLSAREARNEAARLRGQAERLTAQADGVAARNPRRAGVLRDQASAALREAGEQEALATSLEAGTDPRPAITATPSPFVGADEAALENELDAAFAALEAGSGGRPQAWIRLPAHRGLTAPEADSLVRATFSSRSGNPVVFRVEGGSGTMASREFITIGADGRVGINTGGRDLNINIGVFERAVEFILEHRPGARLKIFEVDAEWYRQIRGIAGPEQGRAARLVPVDTAGNPTGPPLRPAGSIADIRGGLRTVDTRQAADQLQIDSELIPELREFVVPNSGRQIEFVQRTSAGAPIPRGGTP